MSPVSSESSERGQNEQPSPTPHRNQRAALRAEKRAESRSADLLPFYEVHADQTKHCKFCL